jgi:hypothetical protein
MKVSPGYSCAFFYDLPVVKKLVSGFGICFIFPLILKAQDSLQLRSFKDSNVYYTPLIFTETSKNGGQQPSKKGSYLLAQDIDFSLNTAAINERYSPSLNPLLLWKLSYPLTEEQIRRRNEEQEREEKIGNQIMNEVFQTIFSRKKLKPVKPTF